MKRICEQMQKYKDELLEDIISIINIPSYRQEHKDGMPYGEGSAKALNYCLKLAGEMGFKVKNVGNYAGHVEYGDGEELVGVLVHCDVVPAGDGWNKKPYSGIIQNGRIYGRGTMDDKGPAISAIYCLKALKDLKIKPNRRIRVIIGASEEQGTDDLEHYFASEEMPDIAFSPDGEYPICNCEKGIMHIRFETGKNDGSLIGFESGEAENIVPVAAKASVSAAFKEKIEQAAKSDNGQCKFEIKLAGDRVNIICTGKSAHASTPEEGINAADGLVNLLYSSLGSDAGTLIEFLSKTVSGDIYGERQKIAYSDNQSGRLTVNLGIVDIGNEAAKATIDIRYPVTASGNAIFDTLEKAAAEAGVKAVLLSDNKPLYVKEDSELVKKLSSAYYTATGEEAKLYASGGGTYARELKNGVAFGAGIKPLSYYNIHGADEFLDISDFMKHCEICLQAIYELSCG